MNILLHRKKYIQNKYIFFLCLFFFLFFQRFRRFSCILKVLYLYETNKYFKSSVFHTSQPALYLFPFTNNLPTLTKKKKKPKRGRGFTLPLFTLLYSFKYCFFSLICVFFSILILFFNIIFIRDCASSFFLIHFL
jgi:hypothetical protein